MAPRSSISQSQQLISASRFTSVLHDLPPCFMNYSLLHEPPPYVMNYLEYKAELTISGVHVKAALKCSSLYRCADEALQPTLSAKH
jgi:hypothetical protein